MIALIAIAAALFLVLMFLFAAIKVAREYERGVIFRLGRLKSPPRASSRPRRSSATRPT